MERRKTIINFRNPSILIRSLVVTISSIAVYRLALLVPLPFLDIQRIKGQLGIPTSYDPTNGHFSILLLGIMPYVSAYILVEIFSLCIPPLKKLRSGSYAGRSKLKRIALILALGLAVFQANSLVSGLKNWTLSDGQSILNVSNGLEHVMLVCVMVAGFYLLVALCELISRFGIGHGISIILLSGICGDFVGSVCVYFDRLAIYGFAPILIAAVVMGVLVSLTYVLLKTKVSIPCYHEKDNTEVDYFQLNLSPSSMAALAYAASITMLPATFYQFFEIGGTLANTLRPGALAYNLMSIFCIFIFSYLFGWAFLHPRRRVQRMRASGWHFAAMDTSAERFLLRRQFIYNLPWTAFLCMMVIVPTTLISAANVPFYIGGRSLPIVVAVAMDLIFGFNFYRKNLHQPIKIAEFHDIYDANMVRNHLDAAGIRSHLQAYHHRLLCYFFGPYLEMRLIVDTRDQESAQMLIQKYYSGLGLRQTI